MTTKILIIFIVIYVFNLIYQVVFEFPILQKRLKDEQENLDEQHAQSGTAFSSKRNEDDKILKIKYKKEILLFWIFSVIVPISLLEKLKKSIFN